MSVLELNKNNFVKEVIESEKPVLIDFWAAWCGPCRMLSPVVDQIAEERAGTLKVVKINIDDEPELAQQFGVMSIPTLVYMKNGKVEATSVGVRPKHELEAMLK